MRAWREQSIDPREAEAAKLLEQGAELPSWDAAGKAEVWRRVRRDAQVTRTPLLLRVAFAGALAFFAFVWLHTRSAPAPATALVASAWTPVDLGPVGRLSVHRDAVYALPTATRDGYRIALTSGQVCAEIAHRDVASQGPLIVQTEQLQVFVIGTRFCVDARSGESIVSVTEGRVRVQSGSGSVFVGAGERIASSDPRLLPTPAAVSAPASPARAEPPPAPLPNAPPVASAPVALAPPPPVLAPTPTSLAEQNALYARGVAARDRHDESGAIAAFGVYLGRFPQGVLAPEAASGILAALVAQGRDVEALAAADAYLRQFPGDGRAAEVAFIRGNVLREKLARTADALVAYQQALRLAVRPALRDDALFAVGACQQKLGHTAEARETLARYKREFPNGGHATEIVRFIP